MRDFVTNMVRLLEAGKLRGQPVSDSHPHIHCESVIRGNTCWKSYLLISDDQGTNIPLCYVRFGLFGGVLVDRQTFEITKLSLKETSAIIKAATNGPVEGSSRLRVVLQDMLEKYQTDILTEGKRIAGKE